MIDKNVLWKTQQAYFQETIGTHVLKNVDSKECLLFSLLTATTIAIEVAEPYDIY